MNIKLLEQVAQAVESHPDQVNMDEFISEYLPSREKTSEFTLPYAGGCGTACCIGGWLAYLGGKQRHETLREFVERHTRPCSVLAMEYGELSSSQAHKLFFLSSWPKRNRDQLEAATTQLDYAKAVAQRVRDFIRDKGTNV